MKKLLLLVALCFCASVASAQTIEIVHLKNGGRIRGIITEQIPNKHPKIQTSDGSIFAYSYDKSKKSPKNSPGKNPHLPTETKYLHKDRHPLMGMKCLHRGRYPLTKTARTRFTLHHSVLITKAVRIWE